MLKGLFSKSLSLKVAVVVIAVLTVSFGYVYFKIQRQLIEAQEREALTLATALDSTVAAMMLKGGGLKPEEIQAVFIELLKQKEIKSAIVYGHDGRKAFTMHPAERGTFIKMGQEEQCLACHRIAPEKRPKTLLVDIPGQGRVMRAVVPIVEKEACLQCHFTGSTMGFNLPGEKYRGMVLVDIETKDMESQLFSIFLALVVTYIATAAAIYFALSRLVTQPIDSILKPVAEIGAGNISARIDMHRMDSIGLLANSINSMAQGLKGLAAKVNAAIGWVETAAKDAEHGARKLKQGIDIQERSAADTSNSINEMNKSAAEISDGITRLTAVSEETSASVLEMTASIEEIAAHTKKLDSAVHEGTSSVMQMTSSIKEVAGNIKVLAGGTAETASSMLEINASMKEIEGNARESGELAHKASEDAGGGKTAVEETIKSIMETRDEIKTSAKIVENLGQASKEIEKILTIINQIAQQTNLLALNASIIASQAGEHGRSFNVVAMEIKKLSDQTAVSIKEIAALIARLKSESDKAVAVMQTSAESMDKSVARAIKAGEVLAGILGSSVRARDVVDGIVKATEEQAVGANVVTEAVERIDNMIKKIAKATHEQSEAAEFVSHIMENMKSLTGQVHKATEEQTSGSRQIAKGAVSVNEMVQGMNKAITGQRKETDNVVKNLQHIINVIKTNADGVKEMEEVVRVLSSQVQILKGEMGRFTI